MKTHLQWIRVTAAAVVVAGAGVQQAAAQYAPYRPVPQQPAAAPAPAAPQQAPAPAARQNPYDATTYTAYRTPPAPTSYQPTPTPAYASPTPAYAASTPAYPSPTPAYASPTGAQYTQPTAAYPQYPQTQTQYPGTYGAYSYVAQQPTPETMPAPKQMNTSAAQPSASAANGSSSSAVMAAPAGGMPMAEGAATQPGCNCTTGAYGAGDCYTTQGCGCQTSGGYPNCGINNYFGDTGCTDNQWFGGIYFLEMGRTNTTPVRLTTQVPAGSAYPYYPPPESTILTSRDANFDFREGVEVRFGSTFTIGDSQSACQSPGGYNMGCGCNSCAPTTYAWEVAWWGLDDSPNSSTVVYDGTNRIYGMKNFVGLQYDRDGAGGAFADRPVNDYYGYALPIAAPPGPPPPDGYIRVLAQRVRTDFKAQDLELNLIRFPVCNMGGCGGDTCGCNTNYTGCNGGCDDGCSSGLGFSMYGSCGVRYFHMDDNFGYDTEFGEASGGVYDLAAHDGFTYDNSNELFYDIQVKNNLVGPQVGWTSDYCWGRWNLFCNSTFGIFDNHITSWQHMWTGGDGTITFAGDGSNFNVRTTKDAVAFLGELRVGTAYEFTCHWRGVIAYRAVAISGLATAQDQMANDYSNRASVGIINSDNSAIIHGAQVGAECRY